MIFFSEFNKNYELIQFKNYKPPYEKTVFIDPGVYKLIHQEEFSRIKEMHALIERGLEPNTYISIDYPPDMNEECSELFIQKTYENNVRYADDPQYICTPQDKMADIDNFYEQFERTRWIWEQPFKILGIGNMCRLLKKSQYKPFVNKVLSYVVDNMKGKWVHVYGCPRWIIKEWKPIMSHHGIKFSVDSTKWTRACTQSLKDNYGMNCMKGTRKLFYEEYIKYL